MSLISVNNLSFSYDNAYDMIFENVSFQIDTDWKLGFIGRNGRGKTTFLNLLMGKYEYSGSITASVNFDYFPFEVENKKRKTMEVVKDIIAPFKEWEKEMEECLRNGNLHRYGEVQELYQKHDGYIIEDLIRRELAKLNVNEVVLDSPFDFLSFGERTKIMIAALFLKKNNFLLIDEPTNHLDMDGREILANYLQSKKGFILVSHDRTFLDKCIDHVLSINKCNIEVQKGNFSSWYQNKTMRDNYEIEKNRQLIKEIASLSEAAKAAEGWAQKVESSKIGEHLFDRGFVGHQAAKMMKRAKSIERRKLEAIEEKKGLLKNIEQAEPLKMNVLPFHKKRMIEFEDVSLYYGDRKIASGIEFCVYSGDRMAVRGRNGSGKTTLFKLILGKDIKYTGKVYVAPGLKISYVSQDTSYLEGTLRDFSEKYGLDETIFKAVLRQMDFERTQFDKNIRDFSLGQKKKVLLAKSLAEPAHIFLWDEPLNYIDIFSRMQLEELILTYKPTIVFIEHDGMFTDKVATKVVNLNM